MSGVLVMSYVFTSSTEGKIFEWYYTVGPLSAVIIAALVIWYICKRRMTGMVSCEFQMAV